MLSLQDTEAHATRESDFRTKNEGRSGAQRLIDVQPASPNSFPLIHGARATRTRTPLPVSGRAPRLLNHLIGAREQRRRNREPERFCRLQIDDEVELVRLIDRHLGRNTSAKNAIHVVRVPAGNPG